MRFQSELLRSTALVCGRQLSTKTSTSGAESSQFTVQRASWSFSTIAIACFLSVIAFHFFLVGDLLRIIGWRGVLDGGFFFASFLGCSMHGTWLDCFLFRGKLLHLGTFKVYLENPQQFNMCNLSILLYPIRTSWHGNLGIRIVTKLYSIQKITS